jgi:hypothetical protein
MPSPWLGAAREAPRPASVPSWQRLRAIWKHCCGDRLVQTAGPLQPQLTTVSRVVRRHSFYGLR